MRKYCLALISICLPLILFLNIGAKMNDKEYFGFSAMLDVVERVPTFENSLNDIKRMEKELKSISVIFNPQLNDDNFFKNASNFFSSIFKLIYLSISFVVSVITDVVNVISFVLSTLGGAILKR